MGERFIEKLGGERFGCARKEGRGRERGERVQEEERKRGDLRKIIWGEKRLEKRRGYR